MATMKIGRVRPVPKGIHSSLNEYSILDIVTNDGSSYMALDNVPIGTLITNTSYWMVIASKGEQGETGVSGSDGDAFQDSFETVSKNLQSYPMSLNYTGETLDSIVYDIGSGNTITKTLNFTGDSLTSIVLSGNTPNGIDLTKTLTYSSGSLTGISYS
jgi:hypothetical protein